EDGIRDFSRDWSSDVCSSDLGFEEYRNVRQESYDLLESRARCKLDIRLNNRKKEALANGIIPKSKIERFSKLDVIADDPRLTERSEERRVGKERSARRVTHT